MVTRSNSWIGGALCWSVSLITVGGGLLLADDILRRRPRSASVAPASIGAVSGEVSARRPGRPSGQALGVLLVIVSAAGFGSGALFVQPLYSAGMAAMVVLFWRFTTAAMASWLYLLASPRRRVALRSLPWRRVAVLLLLGALYVGNSYTYIASLEVVPIALSSIITYIYPAIVAVMALRLVRRLPGRRAWVALGMSLLGVALAVGGVPEGAMPPLWGLALAVASPVIYATWIILQARLTGDRPDGIPPGDAEAAMHVPDPAAAAALMTTATAGVYAVLALAGGASLSPMDVPDSSWLPLLGLGLVATAIAIQTFYAGVARIGGARAALISTVEPIYTIVLATILFDERLTDMQIVGGLLVLCAVVLAETGRHQPAAASTRPAAGR
jgi:drug/metabolite transporter (DMT)-like permease